MCSPSPLFNSPHCCISLCLGIEPPQDEGPPLSLMPDKAELCYICSWSHGYPLVGGLVPRSSGGSGWLYYCSSYEVANPFSSYSHCPYFSIGVPTFRPMFGCVHLHLYWSGYDILNSSAHHKISCHIPSVRS